MADLILLLVTKAPRLSSKRLNRLSEICADIGLVSLGSVALPAILDKLNLILIVSGLLSSAIFWSASIWLAGKEKL